MVWIHGGGFFVGDGTSFYYGPDYIMRKDVVLVTLNYRLGVLGFLNFDEEMAPGNQGLKDVVMALRWVQKNILQFGGDPDNVTIFGQNAGGVMVHYLTISPLAKGLFHKAICQSGVMTVPWAFTEQDDAINNGLMLAQKLGNATFDPEDALKFLKDIDGRKLIAAKNIMFLQIGLDIFLAFTPTVDSKSSNPFLPENPLQLLRNGIEMPIMFGYNSQEGNFFINAIVVGLVNYETLKEINYDFKKAIYPRVLRQLPQLGITVPELRSLYFGNKTVSEKTIKNLSDFIGDQHIYRGIIQAIDTQMNSNVNESTYLYKFSYKSETSPVKKIFFQKPLSGTSHFEELGYLFYPHIGKTFGVLPFARDTPDYKIMEYLTQMWTNFAKTGNPTPSSANFTWSPVKNGTTYDYLNINKKPRMTILIKGNQRWDWENRLKLSKELSFAALSNRVKVNVFGGTLVGIVEESIYGSYNAFRGISYAKPPVGDLRFQDPQPPEPWSSDRDASSNGNVCLQIKTNIVIGEEDCLYLNVYTNDVTPSKKSAVMVWIHGGGFFVGDGTSFYYGPDYIMRKDVVLVTLNYRLGVLGFLNFYEEKAPGNQGLKDVVMALRWVKRNILQFGGDPDNVTIFGQNAGGVIVHYLTISPLAKGLFHKAICQSGVMTVPWAFTEQDDAINNGLMLAQKLGNATVDLEDALKFLKDVDGRKLITAEIGLDILLAFTPTVDSKSSNPFLPENPLQLLRNGIEMPIMFGYNSQEGNFS
ncbi:esterase E4-like isoform X3 [Nylanderia fulva]|uniref:esterase E4-like isoform X3 n=1 Tax=Nylanderia fulva TaxID=613905 RepID=UPI0010FAD961|nr:esterase E4-like isoform X3 [Nylanderia fulva]